MMPQLGAGPGQGLQTQQQLGAIQQATAYTQYASQIASISALNQAKSAYEMAALEARGIGAQLAIQQVNTAASIKADTAALASRALNTQASKSLEVYTLIASVREKTLGLFTNIMEQQTNNSWNRIKSLANNMKF